MESKTLVGIGIGVLAGAVIGGVVALLYAPKSGKETRLQIRDEAIDAFDTVKERAGGVIDTVKGAASEANRKGHAAVHALKS